MRKQAEEQLCSQTTQGATERKRAAVNLLQGPDIDGMLLNYPDSSERKRVEEYLRLLEATIDVASDSIYWLDASGRFVFVNAAACKRLGYGLDELNGKFVGCVNPLIDERRWTEIWQTVKQSKYFTSESLNRSKEGLECPVEVASTYVAVGNREFMCGFARDITQRRRTQLALHESEKRHRTLFQSSRDALMILVPPSWQFCSGNPTAIALFGARDELDFMSRAPWQFSPERQPDGRDSKEKAIEMIESALRDGTTFFEWTHRRASGDDFPATVLLTRIELNGATMVQATVRDESERKRLQGSMAQADRLASMGMLAAGVAHEINNPLAYVRYNTESLAQDIPKLADALKLAASAIRGQLGEAAYAEIFGANASLVEPAALADVVERTRESLEGIERIVAITRGLSTFSRVEQTNRAKVDVSVAIEVAINMAHNELSHRARLVKEIGPMPSVLASEGKLSQVFLNLLVNAAHAIDEGNVPNNQITVRAWPEADQICVEIIDTGKGIAPENLQKIFEPFYTTKGVGVGSGLGLSISRNILSEFGGSLSVTSELGTGSRFLVRLPAMREFVLQSGQGTAPEGRGSVHGRILVVEDEAAINKSLVRLFGHDHQVVSVTSGKEAQDLILSDPNFDFILCDLMMARMSGIEFHAWLVTHDPRLAHQLAFLTGGAFTPKAREYLASVGNLTIEKPFDAKALKCQVSEMIRAARRGL